MGMGISDVLSYIIWIVQWVLVIIAIVLAGIAFNNSNYQTIQIRELQMTVDNDKQNIANLQQAIKQMSPTILLGGAAPK